MASGPSVQTLCQLQHTLGTRFAALNRRTDFDHRRPGHPHVIVESATWMQSLVRRRRHEEAHPRFPHITLFSGWLREFEHHGPSLGSWVGWSVLEEVPRIDHPQTRKASRKSALIGRDPLNARLEPWDQHLINSDESRCA